VKRVEEARLDGDASCLFADHAGILRYLTLQTITTEVRWRGDGRTVTIWTGDRSARRPVARSVAPWLADLERWNRSLRLVIRLEYLSHYTPRFGVVGLLLDLVAIRTSDAGIKEFFDGLKAHAEAR
jgi:hypothetical protein